MRSLGIVVFLATLGGCIGEALDEATSDASSCESRNEGQGAVLLGPATSATASRQLNLSLEDGEDGRPIDVLRLAAMAEEPVGSLVFFARGPHGDIAVSGTGTAAAPWMAVVESPPFGDYEWGVRATGVAAARDLRFRLTIQQGEPPEGCLPKFELAPQQASA